MGGLKKYMPITFATYAIGMLALAGFPLLFSGFWSKDEILHSAIEWSVSKLPFYLGLAGAFLTAFYMTRQVALVFLGPNRSDRPHEPHPTPSQETSELPHLVTYKGEHEAHESPRVMTVPLAILAFFAIVLGFFGTPAWPWFQHFLGVQHEGGFTSDVISLMLISSVIVLSGLAIGWWLYGRKPIQRADEPDVLEKLPLGMHLWFARKYGIDELYEMTVIRFNAWAARACAVLDDWVWGILVQLIACVTIAFGFVSDKFDEWVINFGFDRSCDGLGRGGKWMSRLQNGRVQNYLRIIGVGLVLLVLYLIWGGAK
jgi:NADH-quinone oxidoreductase subunit L